MGKPIINSIYFTKKDQHRPIMTYVSDASGLSIDLHLQVIGFTLSQHTITLQVTDQDGRVKLPPTDQTIDAGFLKDRGGMGIMDTAFYLEMTPEDLINVRRLKFDISFDHEVHATSYLFVTGGLDHA